MYRQRGNTKGPGQKRRVKAINNDRLAQDIADSIEAKVEYGVPWCYEEYTRNESIIAKVKKLRKE